MTSQFYTISIDTSHMICIMAFKTPSFDVSLNWQSQLAGANVNLVSKSSKSASNVELCNNET